MGHLLTVSGSPDPRSANSRFLAALAEFTAHPLRPSLDPTLLPAFRPADDAAPWPLPVTEWRTQWRQARGVIISTPSYLHNLPGILKNGLDWLASSGEADSKPMLAFTFTPASPRGDRARQSLLWSLQALNARILTEGSFYQPDFDFGNGEISGSSRELLQEAMNLLV